MKILKMAGLALLATFLLIQLIPIGRDHTNPPIVREPNWDSPRTRELVQAACFDCHSNETEWPWYSNVAPISWLVYKDTTEGRERLNFSDWGKCRDCSPEEIKEVLLSGEMPLPIYLITHPEARLTDAEKQEIISGIANIK